MNKFVAAIMLSLFIMPSAHAELLWQDTSFSYLRGDDYEVTDNKRHVFTLENASGHTWGSTFLFFDRFRNRNSGTHETYGEVGANFDLVKPEDNFIKRFFIATQVELASTEDNYLYGVGVGLDVPGARFFTASLYARSNGGGKDNNEQLTLTWSFPFADGNFLIDGFMDAASSSDDAESTLNITPQIKWDLGKNAFSMQPGKLWLGIEYVYWNNKFGIKDSSALKTDERNANLLIKWHF